MVLRGQRSRQVRVKLCSVAMLSAEWSITTSMTSHGSEGDGDMASEFDGVRWSETTKSTRGHRGKDRGRCR